MWILFFGCQISWQKGIILKLDIWMYICFKNQIRYYTQVINNFTLRKLEV